MIPGSLNPTAQDCLGKDTENPHLVQGMHIRLAQRRQAQPLKGDPMELERALGLEFMGEGCNVYCSK